MHREGVWVESPRVAVQLFFGNGASSVLKTGAKFFANAADRSRSLWSPQRLKGIHRSDEDVLSARVYILRFCVGVAKELRRLSESRQLCVRF